MENIERSSSSSDEYCPPWKKFSCPPSNKYSCPLLMISHFALEQHTFYNILEDRSYCTKMIPGLLQQFLIPTNQPGWVLVQGDRPLDVEEEEEDHGADDQEEDDDDDDDDDDDTDEDEEDGGDGVEVHESGEEEDDGGGEENNVSDGEEEDGDGDEVHDDSDEDVGEEDDGDGDEVHDDSDEDVGDGDEFGHEDDDGNESGHDDDDNGSAEVAEECDDDESKVERFLWNINLPSEKIPITNYKGFEDISSDYDRCLLSSSPSESGCFIYLFKKKSIFFGRLTDHTLSHRVVSMGDRVPLFGGFITEDGKVICIFGDGEQVVIGTPVYRDGWYLDLTRYIPSQKIDYPIGTEDGINMYFTEYHGEIIYVQMLTYGPGYYYHVEGFWVYRFNFDKRIWEPLDDIGQTAIFIAADMRHPYGFGIRCNVSDEDEKKRLRPNSIYFTYHSKFINIFNIEDQTISYFCPYPLVTDYHSQWIQM